MLTSDKRGDIALYDSLKSQKKKYHEAAQTRAGHVSSVVKILNEYVKDYDVAAERRSEDIKKMKATYIPDSYGFDQENMRIFVEFNDTIAALKEESSELVSEAITTIKEKIANKIGNIPEGALADISIINSMVPKMSSTEIKVLLEKYKDCYFVTKALFLAMTEAQKESVGVEFIDLDSIVKELDELETLSLSLIRSYNGNLPYEVSLILSGEYTKKLNAAYESFYANFGK